MTLKSNLFSKPFSSMLTANTFLLIGKRFYLAASLS